jgi:8-oxo-dGTP pyrophosphatase MutT (NUDIX family)
MAADAPPKTFWRWFGRGAAGEERAAPVETEKRGAGLLLRCAASGDCLLLLRCSRHNDRTWGLPGGNAEPGDGAARAAGSASGAQYADAARSRCAAGGDLRSTALREATEELGPLPRLDATAPGILTRRGKARRLCLALAVRAGLTRTSHARISRAQRGQKEYTVFVCALDGNARAAWVPRLNEEHREWRWFPVAALRGALGAAGDAPPAPLHPVVETLLREHPGCLR